jgi:hypothetical protein
LEDRTCAALKSGSGKNASRPVDARKEGTPAIDFEKHVALLMSTSCDINWGACRAILSARQAPYDSASNNVDAWLPSDACCKSGIVDATSSSQEERLDGGV